MMPKGIRIKDTKNQELKDYFSGGIDIKKNGKWKGLCCMLPKMDWDEKRNRSFLGAGMSESATNGMLRYFRIRVKLDILLRDYKIGDFAKRGSFICNS